VRRPGQLRLAAVLGAIASLATGLALAYGLHRLLGGEGRLAFGELDPAGWAEGLVFVLAFTTALRYVRSVARIPSPTLLSFGLVAPPTAARVAQKVPSVDAAHGLGDLTVNRIVIVEERGVPVGLSGVRRERIVPWDDLPSIDGRIAVTELRGVLAHEPLVIVTDGPRVLGVVTQEMYLAGLWGRAV
jgi:hypothetical protein